MKMNNYMKEHNHPTYEEFQGLTLHWKSKQWIDCEYYAQSWANEDDFTLQVVSNLPKDFYELEISTIADQISNTWRKNNDL